MSFDESNRPPPDTFGIISLALGVVAGAGCIGTCVPYIGVIFMGLSMMLSLIGTILGGIGMSQQAAKEQSNLMSLSGLIINGTVLGLWILYWLAIIGMMLLMFVGFGTLIVLDSM